MQRRTRTALLGAALLSAASVGWVWFDASRALDDAHRTNAESSVFPFDVRRLTPSVSSNVSGRLPSPAPLLAAATLEGKLYFAGPTGLFTQNERYRVGRDLPPAPLTDIVQGIVAGSSTPELWIATAGQGLIAFDGKSFRQVRPLQPELRKVNSVVALSTGRIVFGTDRSGVYVYDGTRISLLHDTLKGVRVTTMAGSDAGVWIGTVDRGVLHWHAGQVDSYEALPDKHVLSLTVAGDGAYVGTALGVAFIAKGRTERTLAEGAFARALLYHDNRLLIGTVDEGILDVPLPSGRARFYESSAPVERLFTARDGTGPELIALTAKGAYKVRSGEALFEPEQSPLSDRNIAALSFDDTGRLWIGYFDRGLDVVEPSGAVRHYEDEHLFCVNRILHTRDMHAVATANGLVLLDHAERKRQVLRREDGLISNHITDVVADGGRLVVSTPAGITFLNETGPASLYALHGLVNNHAYALGSSGATLLVGTLGGLSTLEAGAVHANYTTSNSALRHNWITSIARLGADWFIGTYGAGVAKLDASGRWLTFDDMNGIVVNPGAMIAHEGRIYAGTLDRGLLMYENGRWRAESSGLPSLNVTAIAARNGAIAIGTDNGLVQLR